MDKNLNVLALLNYIFTIKNLIKKNIVNNLVGSNNPTLIIIEVSVNKIFRSTFHTLLLMHSGDKDW